MKTSFGILLYTFLMHISVIQAQGGIFLNGGVHVVCNNTPYIVIQNGKWKNTASTFTSANSTVKFTGNASTTNSTIEGNTTFNIIELAKSSNDLLLVATTTTIKDRFLFTTGKLNLGGKPLQLNSTAKLVSESESARSYGVLANGKCTITTSLINPVTNNVGDLGMVFTVGGNLGSTTVDRRHAVQTLPSGNSIQKHWRVTAATPAGWNATLRYYYFDAQLNGLNEANLTVWRSTNNGATWTDMGVTTRNTTSNYVEKTAVADVSGWWTLGEVPPVAPVSNNRSGDTIELSEQQLSENKWSVFPNPAGQWISIQLFSDSAQSMLLEILGVDGKIAHSSQQQVFKGENTVLLDISTLPSGVYIARVANHTFQPIRIVKSIATKQ